MVTSLVSLHFARAFNSKTTKHSQSALKYDTWRCVCANIRPRGLVSRMFRS
jgi:hypothetical protein